MRDDLDTARGIFRVVIAAVLMWIVVCILIWPLW